MGKVVTRTDEVKTASGPIRRDAYGNVEFWFPVFNSKNSIEVEHGYFKGEVDDWGSDERMSKRNHGIVIDENEEGKLGFLGVIGINALKFEGIRTVRFTYSWSGIMLFK